VKIVVIGLGQSMRGDDAAGLRAVQLWEEKFPQTASKVQIALLETPGLNLLDWLDGVEAAILVDAVKSSDKAGTLQHISPEDLYTFSTDAGSVHGWGVAETLALGRALSPRLAACRISLIGICGSDFSLGAGLSPAVQAALTEAASLIEKEVQAHL
jgi:hydrogenase maturation protease